MIAPSPAPDELKIKDETRLSAEVKDVKVVQSVVDDALIAGDKLDNDKVIATPNTEIDSVVATEVGNPEPSKHEPALNHQEQKQKQVPKQVQKVQESNQPMQEQVHTQEQKQQEELNQQVQVQVQEKVQVQVQENVQMEVQQQVQVQVQKPEQGPNQQEQVQALNPMEQNPVLAQEKKDEKLPEAKQGEVRNELGVIRVYADSKNGLSI